MSGLKRMMQGARHPYQKEPFNPAWFPTIADAINLQSREDRLFFLLITLAYSFFMRISEVLSLRAGDVGIAENGMLRVHFWKTKTDQFAAGTVCFLSVRDGVACPSRYLDVLKGIPGESCVCTLILPNEITFSNAMRQVFGYLPSSSTEIQTNSVRHLRSCGLTSPLKGITTQNQDSSGGILRQIRHWFRRGDLELHLNVRM